jgi:DNA-binding transcriptional ArsR family regulator
MQGRNSAAPGLPNPATVFAALGDPVRLAIIARLCADGPLQTIQLKQSTSLTRQAVTKHLWVLEDVGLVRSDRFGRNRSWRIDARQLEIVRAYLDQISARWDARLERLQSFIEDDDN